MSAQEIDIDALVSRRRGPGRWLLLLLLVIVAVVAVLAWIFTSGEEETAVFAPQRVTATSGQLTTTVELSGSAEAARTSTLSFAVGGEVESVEVAVGEEVMAGAILARLDGGDALRQLETAEVQLTLARLQLEELLETPAASQLAASERSLATARAQVVSAQLAVEQLDDSPDASVVDAAEQALANARNQLSSAQEALADLVDDASAGDVAKAEQAVANASSQLSASEAALSDLTSDPTDAQIASAEQAVANAAAQLTSARKSLTDLTDEPSVADVEGARSAVAQARNPLTEADESVDRTWEALEDAHERFCDDIVVLPEICESDLPLSEAHIALLESETENSGRTLTIRAQALIDAQGAWESAVNVASAASATLMAAEARLDDLIAAPDAEDVRQATEAVSAAASALEAAEAQLDELLTPATDADVRQAELAVDAARAGLTAARADLNELLGDADRADVYQAEQAVAAARAQRDSAQAQLAELLAPPTEDEIIEAELNLVSARSSLSEANAQHEELLAGATAISIAKQEQNVRLAEISLEQAQAALDDLVITAPHDGTVEEAYVESGDRVSVGGPAFVISDRADVVVALTVTEAEIFDLREEQVGVAAFDAIEGSSYPVRITSISRVPNVEQGVVTYAVEASVLSPAEIQVVREELQALGVAVPEPQVAGAGPRAGQGEGRPANQGAGPAGAATPEQAQRFQAWLQSLDLPPGVTVLTVVQAIANDEPLPDGVELPEDFEITEDQRAQLRTLLARFSGGGGGSAAGGRAAFDDDRLLPVDGMSATVTILTAVRDEAVLLATSAVRQIDGVFFVALPTVDDGWERVGVQIGESDGVNVEILDGLDAGDTVLVGVDSEGIAYSATQLPASGGATEFGPPGGAGGGRPGGG